MASVDISPTLKFLTDAGHLLVTTAPEISAFLMSQRNGLMFENELPPLSDFQRQHVCTCCGHIMILGHGSSLTIKPKQAAIRKTHRAAQHRRGKETREATPSSGPTKQFACGHCGRLTEIKLPAPSRISRRKAKSQKAAQATGATAATTSAAPVAPSSLAQFASQDAPRPNANASSKKRAKSRKAGLQALLEQKSASRSGLGLSLSDFMQK
ncbi:hypothetical protein B0T22DRAFT_483577 [Podospora appendiculata]|uniref:Uncharacterized protein n=1 Tax=Podospora appendiculata TaxID=314037 RepID=A0AAE1C962_9PEZI|nr:hypothetical protein B0T22DRAFT_483577 [Podospora appendiculata]